MTIVIVLGMESQRSWNFPIENCCCEARYNKERCDIFCLKNLFKVMKCYVVVMMTDEDTKFWGMLRMRSLH